MWLTQLPEAGYLTRLADGTVKQINPFTGSDVWTVPGRADRPLGLVRPERKLLGSGDLTGFCAFCPDRYLETTPEKARIVRDGDRWRALESIPAEELFATTAEFRRIPNLFEILSFDYWHANYGYVMPDDVRRRRAAYLSSEAGLDHVLRVVKQRLTAGGMTEAEWEALSTTDRLERATGFFGSTHDVIVARRHFVEGATHDDQLASSGTLSAEEHHRYLAFTVESMRSLYAANRYARYVAVFQNWLKPAGASFDHLHKQLVAIDERGVQTELELSRLRANLNLFNEAAVNYAAYQNLLVAENEHAVAFAGFGHRYPTLEIYSKSAAPEPWLHSTAELRAMSDLIHACHAATGPDVPCNEEWHHRPPDVDMPMPWRVLLKWRVSTLAGFEGGTKIYLNTIDPWLLRDRVVPELFRLRAAGHIAADTRIATECECRPNCLRYNPLLR
ncbi:MAG: DUF4921 family protein [Propionibacteriaceae bacterium]|nr:DUF4921 family protein [Propionibacteriaceae bacterium]